MLILANDEHKDTKFNFSLLLTIGSSGMKGNNNTIQARIGKESGAWGHLQKNWDNQHWVVASKKNNANEKKFKINRQKQKQCTYLETKEQKDRKT